MISQKTLPYILIFAGLGIVSAIMVVKLINSKKPTAGLKIDTTPASLVFVDNVQIGKTPIDQMFPPGEVTVKLVPDSASALLSSFQTKVRLTDQVYTLIKRDFGDTDSRSFGETISLVPQSGKKASLSIITSDPDSASVTIDKDPQGFTPLTLSDVNPQDHQIEISSPGYESHVINAKAVAGYNLQITAKLAAKDASASPTPTPKAVGTGAPVSSSVVTPSQAPQNSNQTVRILSTPNGWLRVRLTSSTTSPEMGKVNPGQTFPLISSKPGWYEIKVQLTSTSSGWISSEFAEKVD